ncbi:MAG: hypothetical protein GX946_02210 [Oligosphaeraceae bacterium]|nr:hypothetical protein [Oligosphaeraceae bacterium]
MIVFDREGYGSESTAEMWERHRATNPGADRAIFELPEQLNQTETIYPESNLTMIFESAASKIKSQKSRDAANTASRRFSYLKL